MIDSEYFRAGVVIVIWHPTKFAVMAFERADSPGSWQLPQGGIDVGEDPHQAARREMLEETGLAAPNDIELAYETNAKWIPYEWPLEFRVSGRHGAPGCIGQVQMWFNFTVREAAVGTINPTFSDGEFTQWKWMDPDDLVKHVAWWRRPAYEKGLLGRWR